MSPVVAEPACNVCSYTPDCGCDACGGGVAQAAYAEPACSSCGGGTTTVAPGAYGNGAYDNYAAPAYGSSVGGQNVGPQTPAPTMAPVPEPENSRYDSRRPIAEERERDVLPPEEDRNVDPRPADETDSSTYSPYPQLLDPRDRTAARSNSRKPTVGVWNAVYRQTGANNQNVSRTSARRETRSQAEIDADGWSAVAPASR